MNVEVGLPFILPTMKALRCWWGMRLLTEAFALLARQPLPAETVVALIQELSTALVISNRRASSRHRIKWTCRNIRDVETTASTEDGRLLTVSATMGARVAQADPDQLLLAKQFGETIGLAFQLADDVLDAEEDAGSDGPPSYVKFWDRVARLTKRHDS